MKKVLKFVIVATLLLAVILAFSAIQCAKAEEIENGLLYLYVSASFIWVALFLFFYQEYQKSKFFKKLNGTFAEKVSLLEKYKTGPESEVIKRLIIETRREACVHTVKRAFELVSSQKIWNRIQEVVSEVENIEEIPSELFNEIYLDFETVKKTFSFKDILNFWDKRKNEFTFKFLLNEFSESEDQFFADFMKATKEKVEEGDERFPKGSIDLLDAFIVYYKSNMNEDSFSRICVKVRELRELIGKKEKQSTAGS